ncbi:hypothetical protein ASG73_04275 [Janibacter sp. Soil728]|nr:hypothetical protein ASG73_04275 [Janibacter sp. Soil728]
MTTPSPSWEPLVAVPVGSVGLCVVTGPGSTDEVWGVGGGVHGGVHVDVVGSGVHDEVDVAVGSGVHVDVDVVVGSGSSGVVSGRSGWVVDVGVGELVVVVELARVVEVLELFFVTFFAGVVDELVDRVGAGGRSTAGAASATAHVEAPPAKIAAAVSAATSRTFIAAPPGRRGSAERLLAGRRTGSERTARHPVRR